MRAASIRSYNPALRTKPLAFSHSPFFAPVPQPWIKMGVQAMSLAVLNLRAKPRWS